MTVFSWMLEENPGGKQPANLCRLLWELYQPTCSETLPPDDTPEKRNRSKHILFFLLVACPSSRSRSQSTLFCCNSEISSTPLLANQMVSVAGQAFLYYLSFDKKRKTTEKPWWSVRYFIWDTKHRTLNSNFLNILWGTVFLNPFPIEELQTSPQPPSNSMGGRDLAQTADLRCVTWRGTGSLWSPPARGQKPSLMPQKIVGISKTCWTLNSTPRDPLGFSQWRPSTFGWEISISFARWLNKEVSQGRVETPRHPWQPLLGAGRDALPHLGSYSLWFSLTFPWSNHKKY